MTMTLEKIQGMNIPVGAPIEFSVGVIPANSKNPIYYPTLGYYQDVDNLGNLLYKTGKRPIDKTEKCSTSVIEDIKILEYKK
jgi:hypothetical protein